VLGFRFTALTRRNTLINVDFYKDEYDQIPMYQKQPLLVLQSGVAHAAIFSWEVFSDLNETYVHAETAACFSQPLLVANLAPPMFPRTIVSR